MTLMRGILFLTRLLMQALMLRARVYTSKLCFFAVTSVTHLVLCRKALAGKAVKWGRKGDKMMQEKQLNGAGKAVKWYRKGGKMMQKTNLAGLSPREEKQDYDCLFVKT